MGDGEKAPLRLQFNPKVLLEFLYEGGYRLPNTAQSQPCADVAAQPDFYYERDGVPGACVFVDGSDHLSGGAGRPWVSVNHGPV